MQIVNGLRVGGVFVYVLGRMRKVTEENGKKYITYKKQKLTISEARKLQRELMARG